MNTTIIGGGIAGLTTALALNKMGVRCEVYEKAGELNEVGAGIWIQPNAMKVLSWLGLSDKVKESGALLNEVDITNSQLVPFKKTSREVIRDRKEGEIIAIHRAKLQRILYEAMPENSVHLGCAFNSYHYDKNKLLISVGAKIVTTDLLIGADGIHSKVRGFLVDNSEFRYSGQTCWRGISTIELPALFQHSGIESWGNKIRFGFSQIAKDKVYWFAVTKTNNMQLKDLKAEILSLYAKFHPLVADIIQKTESEKIISNAIIDLKRLNKWSTKNVLVIGDAAHASTPNMGQGAGQAIEDAYYLANLLTIYKDVETTLNVFEATRRKKVDYVVNNSWRFGKMAHNSFGQLIMKTLMKLTPEKVVMKQMKSLYSIQENF